VRESYQNRITVVDVPISREQAELQAQKNIQAINARDELQGLQLEFLAALQLPIAQKARLYRIQKIADRMSAAVVPYSACQSGCSYCCHIPVTISALEADAIGKATGRSPVKGVLRQSCAETAHYHRQPCPFLDKGKCSIYNERPVSCRLMFNLSDSPYYCNTDIDPDKSHVMLLNLKKIEFAFTGAFMNSGFADIRDYFPSRLEVLKRNRKG